MKECEKSINGTHIWDDEHQSMVTLKDGESKTVGRFFKHQSWEQKRIRKIFPKCSLCGVVDNSKPPREETDVYEMTDEACDLY